MDWKGTRNWNGIVKMNSWPNRKRNCSLVPGASRVPPDPPTPSTYPSASNNPDTTGLWLGSNPAASLDQGFGQTGRLGWSFCTGQRALGRLYFSVPMLGALGNVAGWRGAKHLSAERNFIPVKRCMQRSSFLPKRNRHGSEDVCAEEWQLLRSQTAEFAQGVGEGHTSLLCQGSWLTGLSL